MLHCEDARAGTEKILVINCGSSSIKYSFFDTADKARNAHGAVDRLGIEGTQLVHRGPEGETKRALPNCGFAGAFHAITTELTTKETGVIGNEGELTVIAHRVVHG